MPDTVIDRFNLLGKYQHDILIFTDCKGRIIGDGDVELTVVDGDGDENDPSLKFKIKMISTIKRIKSRSIPSRRTKPLFNKPPNYNFIPYNKDPP